MYIYFFQITSKGALQPEFQNNVTATKQTVVLKKSFKIPMKPRPIKRRTKPKAL